MDHRPLEVFARLLATGPKPGWDSYHVAEKSDDFYDSPDRRQDAEEAITRYTKLGLRVAADLETAWGPPAFIGEVREAPPTEWAYWRSFVWMACWPRAEAQAFVAVCHQDTELPVFLLFGVEDANPA